MQRLLSSGTSCLRVKRVGAGQCGWASWTALSRLHRKAKPVDAKGSGSSDAGSIPAASTKVKLVCQGSF